MEKTAYHWGIIGTGLIAHDMAEAIKSTGGILYGVGGTGKEKAERFAQECGVSHAYENCDRLLADPEIEIVYIATPHNLHYEYLKKAVLAGKHVLCEKAITVCYEQLREIVDLAAEKKVVVMEAMTIYHMPLFKRLRELVDHGAIGKVKMVQVNFGSLKEYDPNNRFFKKELAGGALLDIGTYAVSFARYFLGKQPNTVLSTVQYTESSVDEESGILLKNDLGEMGVIALTMRAKQPKRGVVAGDLGYIEVYDYPRADRAEIVYTGGGNKEHVPGLLRTGDREMIECGNKERALEYEVLDMEAAVMNQTGGESLILSLDVMELLSRVMDQWEREKED